MPRTATRTDFAEIIRVTNAAYVVEKFFKDGDRVDAEYLERRFTVTGAEFIVIDSPTPGQLAATVAIEPRGDRAFFGLLAVDPAEQGRGHARALMHAMEEWCRARSIPFLELDIVDLRTELPAFYEKFGFVVTGERELISNQKLLLPCKLIVMEKRIDAR